MESTNTGPRTGPGKEAMFRMKKSRTAIARPGGRRSAGALTASATAALALTAGVALPACATDAGNAAATTEQVTDTVTSPATGDAAGAEGANADRTGETSAADDARSEAQADGQADGRLEEAIEMAKAEGHISDDEWVSDPSFEIARGEDGDVSAQVITIAGGTGSSPQAVLLYGPGHGKYVTTAPVPEDVAGDAQWGDRVGNVKRMGLTLDKDIGVLWTHPDGQSANVTYRYHNGYFDILTEE